jgi:hypothetical protein
MRDIRRLARRSRFTPGDRMAAEALGVTPEEYSFLVESAQKRSRTRPSVRLGKDEIISMYDSSTSPTAFDPLSALITIGIGLVLSAVSYALSPRQRQNSPGESPRQANQDPLNVVAGSNFAPTSGFSSSPALAEQDALVPVVYCKRQEVAGVAYGGVRVNGIPLWSQMWSLGGSHGLRLIFALGKDGMSIDADQIASGESLFTAYDLSSNTSSRISVYFRNTGGHITGANYLAGRVAGSDPFNSENSGGPVVFASRRPDGVFIRDNCRVIIPESGEFGWNGVLGNNLGIRANPPLIPIWTPQFQVDGSNFIVYCYADLQQAAEREKANSILSCRAGLFKLNGSNVTTDGVQLVQVGSTVTYLFSSTTDADNSFIANSPTPDQEEGEAFLLDLGQSVASKQREWLSSLSEGDEYAIGDGIFVCTKPGERFLSDADNQPIGGGYSTTAEFLCVRQGMVDLWTQSTIERGATQTSSPHVNGTMGTHIHKLKRASFGLNWPAAMVEIGFEHSLGMRYNGFANIRNSLTREEMDNKACLDRYETSAVPGEEVGKRQPAGTYTGPDEAYAFFNIMIRAGGQGGEFSLIERTFGFRGSGQVAVKNYLKLLFLDDNFNEVEVPWEGVIEPVSGNRVRKKYGIYDLRLLDYRSSYRTEIVPLSLQVGNATTVYIGFNGEYLANDEKTFRSLPSIATRNNGDLGVNQRDPGEGNYPDERSYVDAYAKVAELFWYNEVTSNSTQPSMRIAYVNQFSKNCNLPTYDGLTLLGMTLRASGSGDLGQISAFINSGTNDTSSIGDKIYDLLTNQEWGAGSTIPAALVDQASFDAASARSDGLLHFYDGTLTSISNARSKARELAELYMYDLTATGGKLGLEPFARFHDEDPYQIEFILNHGNIRPSDPENPNSEPNIELVTRPPESIGDIICIVRYRQELPKIGSSANGLFPRTSDVTVKRTGTPATADVVFVDISEVSTSRKHAIDLAKMQVMRQKLITHDIVTQVELDAGVVKPGSVGLVATETLEWDSPQAGTIDKNGNIVWWPDGNPAISDGSYNIVYYKDSVVAEAVIGVTSGVSDTSETFGSIFTVATVSEKVEAYKVRRVDFTEDGGALEVELQYFPLDSTLRSEITANWDEGWTITGDTCEITPIEPPSPPQMMWVSTLNGTMPNDEFDPGILIKQTLAHDDQGNSYTVALNRDTVLTPNPQPEYLHSIAKRNANGDVLWVKYRVTDRLTDLDPGVMVGGGKLFVFFYNQMHTFDLDGNFLYACSFDDPTPQPPKNLFYGGVIFNTVTGLLNIITSKATTSTTLTFGAQRLLAVNPDNGNIVNSWELTGFDDDELSGEVGKHFGPYLIQLSDGRVKLYGQVFSPQFKVTVVTLSADLSIIQSSNSYSAIISPPSDLGNGVIAFRDLLTGYGPPPSDPMSFYFVGYDDTTIAKMEVPATLDTGSPIDGANVQSDRFIRLTDGSILWIGPGPVSYFKARALWLAGDLSGDSLGELDYTNESQLLQTLTYPAPYSFQSNTIVLTLQTGSFSSGFDPPQVIGLPFDIPLALREVEYSIELYTGIGIRFHRALRTDATPNYLSVGSLPVSPLTVTAAASNTVRTDLTPLPEPWLDGGTTVTFTKTELLVP